MSIKVMQINQKSSCLILKSDLKVEANMPEGIYNPDYKFRNNASFTR